jgi:hypothetical protein
MNHSARSASSSRSTRRLASALALLVLPAALVSCDALKRKLGGGGGAASLAFTPSNVDLTGMDLSKVGDFKVDDANCTLSSEDLTASCGNGGDVLAFKLAKQADGSPIAVYVARSIHIPAKMTLTIQGKNPVALIALDTIDIRGSLVAAAAGETPIAGGHGPAKKENARGPGPGGGSAATTATGGGGAAHCGKGGAGANEVGKAAPAVGRGGAAYGAASLVPLLGGSAGGAAAGGAGGAGGGALQLIAKTSITIAAGGVVNVGGGGGEFGGEASGQEAAGGGSGGSILLEAQDVSVAGTLAANGGGGGSGTSSNIPSGANGTGNATPAPGGASNGISTGGSGSGGARIDGANGAASPDKTAGGGGGGAGRIRINTKSGVATLAGGTLSPPATTTCTTQGKLVAAAQ